AAGAGCTPVVPAGQLVGAQRIRRLRDPFAEVGHNLGVHHLAGVASRLVEIEDLDDVRILPGKLSVAEHIQVQLVTGQIRGLGAFAGLEVDDRRLLCVQPLDQVDTAGHGDTGDRVDLDGRLGVPRLVEGRAMAFQVAAHGRPGGWAELDGCRL